MTKFLGIFFLTLTLTLAQELEGLKSKLANMLSSSFTANFTMITSKGETITGKIYYQAPNKLHLRTSDGGIIATNGTHLWIYNPAVSVCAKQEVSQNSPGILGWLSSYTATVKGETYLFRKDGAYYEEVLIATSQGKLTSIRLKHGEETTTYQFSNVETGITLKPTLFNYKPPAHVQVVENPMKP